MSDQETSTMDSSAHDDAIEQSSLDPEAEMVAALYNTVTRLNEQIVEARKHHIEVTIDVEYIRMLDAYRPHDAIVGLKVAKLLQNRERG
jgi:hypothetical protein